MMSKLISRACLLIIFCILPLAINAHENRPLYIQIEQIKEDTYMAKIKVPPTIKQSNRPTILFPEYCSSRGSKHYFQIAKCQKPLAGDTITIEYPLFAPSVSTMIRYKNLNEEQHTVLLSPEERSWVIPESETVSAVAKQYMLLGGKHILEGWDHLLFLVCLLLIAGTGRRVFITITGFTIAHSITLALSALELVRLPIPPVEAIIALSVVFLATEIAKKRRDTLTWKYPIAVSSSFGLLHGFAFAAVLGEIGLPQTELLTGLLFFNIGVEIGQIIFVLAVFSLIKILMKLKLDIHNPIFEKTITYSIGIVASFWMIERIAKFY